MRGSGCGGIKGDLRSDHVMVEAKSSRSDRSRLPAVWFAKAAAQSGHRVPIVQFGFAERFPGSTLRCLRWAFIRRRDVEATNILRVPAMTLDLTMIAQDGTSAAAWNTVEERVVGERTARVVVMRNGISWIPVPEYWITPEILARFERKS